MIHVIRVNDDLLDLAVLTEQVVRRESALGGNLWRQAYHVHECFLNDAQTSQLSHLVLGERRDGYAHLIFLEWIEAERLHGLDTTEIK